MHWLLTITLCTNPCWSVLWSLISEKLITTVFTAALAFGFHLVGRQVEVNMGTNSNSIFIKSFFSALKPLLYFICRSEIGKYICSGRSTCNNLLYGFMPRIIYDVGPLAGGSYGFLLRFKILVFHESKLFCATSLFPRCFTRVNGAWYGSCTNKRKQVKYRWSESWKD